MITAETILSEKKMESIWVPPETTIHDSIEIMNSHKVGAILIKENDHLVGIWTERDLMYGTVKDGFDPRLDKIGDFMTTGLIKSPHDTTIYALLDQFLGRRLRHIIIEKEGEFLGLLSTRDVIKACLQEKDQELKDLNKIASWSYYEDWGGKSESE